MAESDERQNEPSKADEYERRRQRRKAPPRPMLKPHVLAAIRRRVSHEGCFQGSREQHVEAAIRAAGPTGLTDCEGEVVTGYAGNSYRPRRRSREQDGKVVRKGSPRSTPTGRKADVWIHTDVAKRLRLEAERRDRDADQTG